MKNTIDVKELVKVSDSVKIPHNVGNGQWDVNELFRDVYEVFYKTPKRTSKKRRGASKRRKVRDSVIGSLGPKKKYTWGIVVEEKGDSFNLFFIPSMEVDGMVYFDADPNKVPWFTYENDAKVYVDAIKSGKFEIGPDDYGTEIDPTTVRTISAYSLDFWDLYPYKQSEGDRSKWDEAEKRWESAGRPMPDEYDPFTDRWEDDDEYVEDSIAEDINLGSMYYSVIPYGGGVDENVNAFEKDEFSTNHYNDAMSFYNDVVENMGKRFIKESQLKHDPKKTHEDITKGIRVMLVSHPNGIGGEAVVMRKSELFFKPNSVSDSAMVPESTEPDGLSSWFIYRENPSNGDNEFGLVSRDDTSIRWMKSPIGATWSSRPMYLQDVVRKYKRSELWDGEDVYVLNLSDNDYVSLDDAREWGLMEYIDQYGNDPK